MKFEKVMFSQVFVCPQGGVSVQKGSLSRGVFVQGVSVQGVSVQGGHCPGDGGLCPGGLCPGGLCQGDPPVWLRACGMHPTGMHSCLVM